MDNQDIRVMINLLDMERPLCELMPHIPEVLLNELTVNENAAASFAMHYQAVCGDELITVERQAKLRRNVEKIAVLEQMRRKRNLVIKVWPRDFADETFWNEVRLKGTTLDLKAA